MAHTKAIVVLACAVIHLGSGYCKEPDPDLAIFDQMFEHFDVDTVLRNHRLVDSYLNCFLNVGSCSNMGSEAKALIPEVIRTRCATCGENQKDALRKGLKLFIALRPTDWEKLLDIYDPERKELPHIKAFLDDKPTITN